MFTDGSFLHQFNQGFAEAKIERHHAHVNSCFDGHARGLFVIFGHHMPGIQVADILPIGDHDAFKPQLVAQQIGQQVTIGVHWDAVDLATINHDGHGTSIYGRLERREKIFPQLAFWNPGGGAVFSGQRKAITEEMLQCSGEWDVSVLVSLNHGHP